MKKILYGICGIGNGHTFRQLPRLKHYLSLGHRVLAFAYQNSYDILSNLTTHFPNLKVVKVDIPYIVGTPKGLDFGATAQKINLQSQVTNFNAMNFANDYLGKPDLVISDYEPVSAQYAYAFDAPFITIDQQSKYLFETCPPELNGTTYQDEIMRLRLFFPKATKRYACSFFDVPRSEKYPELSLIPAPVRDELYPIKANRMPQNIMTVYYSDQHIHQHSIHDHCQLFNEFPNFTFNVFLPKSVTASYESPNVCIKHHGDPLFLQSLRTCQGLISTAGHSLLSEAVFLQIPVLALPLKIYEQQMNAFMIDSHRLGLSSEKLTYTILESFINQLDDFNHNLKAGNGLLIGSDQPNLI